VADHPWVWRTDGNPYRETLFQILDLDPTVTRSGAIKAHADRRLKRIKNAPERYPLFGRPLTEARVNRAAHAIRDPEARVYALLCTHHPRAAEVDLAEFATRLADVPLPEPDAGVTIDVVGLLRAAPPLPPLTGGENP
jgi:hypothetical protein